MKIKDLNIDDFSVKNKLTVDGHVEINTQNGYTIIIDPNPNWFQRMLYKLLGFKVKQNGNN